MKRVCISCDNENDEDFFIFKNEDETKYGFCLNCAYSIMQYNFEQHWEEYEKWNKEQTESALSA